MIYLDYQATTPLAPEAFETMVPLLRDQFANPHSAHRAGRMVAAQVELARDAIGQLLPPAGRLLFTSGATEALNLAIRGALPALAPRGVNAYAPARHLVRAKGAKTRLDRIVARETVKVRPRADPGRRRERRGVRRRSPRAGSD